MQADMLEEMTPAEKLWLLAGEVLRDQGTTDVTPADLSRVLGQALACVLVYSTPDPFDPKVTTELLDDARQAFADAQIPFLEAVRTTKDADAGRRRKPGGDVL